MFAPQDLGLAVGVSLSVVIATFLFRVRRLATQVALDFISAICDWYLRKVYPIKNESRTKDFPSLPYRFPNGNGDVAKFLQGRENAEEWKEKYGSMYRIWAGTSSEVVVSDPEHLKVIFKDSDQHFKAVNNDSGYLMSQVLGQCVGLLSGKAWKDVRAQVETPFTHVAIAQNADIIREQTLEYVQKLVTTGDFKNGLFDPAKTLSFYPFLTVATLLFGKLDEEDVLFLRKLSPTRQKLFTYVIRGGLARFPISKYFPTTANKLLREFQQEWLQFNEKIYKKNLAKGTRSPMSDLWERSQRGEIDQVQLLQTLDESLFANLDVTTGAISWNFIYLASSPENQDQLAKEIKDIGTDDAAWDAYIARSDTFLAACISESSRLRPVAPFSIPQAPPSDRKVGEWIIPKKTMVIVDTYGLNIRNPFWGKDSNDYRPDRFIGLKPGQVRYNMWRYGFGPRQCMGKYVADRMVRSIVAVLIRDYHFELRELEQGNDWSVNPDEWITHPDMRLICNPRA